jgi:hypothetical protein
MLARIGDVTSRTITSDPHDPSAWPEDPPTPLGPPRTIEDVGDMVAAVPEPGTIALVTIGLVSLGARRRLRQR